MSVANGLDKFGKSLINEESTICTTYVQQDSHLPHALKTGQDCIHQLSENLTFGKIFQHFNFAIKQRNHFKRTSFFENVPKNVPSIDIHVHAVWESEFISIGFILNSLFCQWKCYQISKIVKRISFVYLWTILMDKAWICHPYNWQVQSKLLVLVTQIWILLEMICDSDTNFSLLSEKWRYLPRLYPCPYEPGTSYKHHRWRETSVDIWDSWSTERRGSEG